MLEQDFNTYSCYTFSAAGSRSLHYRSSQWNAIFSSPGLTGNWEHPPMALCPWPHRSEPELLPITITTQSQKRYLVWTSHTQGIKQFSFSFYNSASLFLFTRLSNQQVPDCADPAFLVAQINVDMAYRWVSGCSSFLPVFLIQNSGWKLVMR